MVKNYKRNGYYKEFYENGDLKYEGKFLNDEYNDDNGKYIDEQGYIYLGKFEEGKKNGEFFIIKNDNEFESKLFKDDKIVNDKEDKPVDTIDEPEEKKKETIEKKDEPVNTKNEPKVETLGDGGKTVDEKGKSIGGGDEPIKEKDNNKDDNGNDDTISFWKNLGSIAFHYLKDVGDDIGYICPGCRHPSDKHTEIKIGVWTCSECPEGNNTCIM